MISTSVEKSRSMASDVCTWVIMATAEEVNRILSRLNDVYCREAIYLAIYWSQRNEILAEVYLCECGYVDNSHAIVQPCAWWTRRLCFVDVDLDTTEMCKGHTLYCSAVWLRARCRMRSAASTGGVFRAASWARNLCSRGPRGLKFFMHSHPLMGGRPPKFQKKIRRKNFFFVLLVPLTIRLITPVLRVLGVWNLLCVLTPLMRDRLPHFCFKNSTKIVHFFNFFKKKPFLGEFPLLRLITSVLMDLGVWNLLCVFTSSRGTE